MSIKKLCSAITKDLKDRFPEQRATQRRKLGELVSAVLMCQSPNLMEISNVLDRPCHSVEARYNYVERFLKNSLVSHQEVMRVYATELLERLSRSQHTLVLMIDQSKVNARFELLMVSVRVQKRALPLFWCVKETKGGIGFEEQKKILEVVYTWIPKGHSVMLAGDRFYGTSSLIRWCQEKNWKYRLRLKGNLLIYQDYGPEKTLDILNNEGVKNIQRARMHTGIITHIGILHEKGHKEPWYIAMDSTPSEYKTRDYGMRWGIEGMFADFKSRGLSLTQTQIKLVDRLERLLLLFALAFHWAVSVGMYVKKKRTNQTKAKKPDDPICRFLNLAYVNSNSVLLWLQNHRLYGAL